QPPTTRNRTTNVTVMVKDNDTLVIGGLITENDIDSIQKIPVLSDLPILGYLFQYKSKNTSKTELLVFITPRILPD
ncbi:MAG: type II and III secretion system protein, partial [Elusimicrobia bacterium]|nr:type II and III secretion system protein [Elusimicrobiota bacterium]